MFDTLNRPFLWVKEKLYYFFVLILLDKLTKNLVKCGGDLGSIECVNGKWQADTKIISLVVVCPIQMSWESLMCAFKRLGLYENGGISEDFHIFICSLFWDREVIQYCIVEFARCLNNFGGLGLLEFTMVPVGMCLWNAIHEKVNCTI